MAYVKNTWVDREGQTRYHETIDDDGALIFTPDYEKVTEIGTPVNADNMNHIEDGIADHENRITVLENSEGEDYVKKSGDTMTGDLTINKAQGSVAIKNPSLDTTTIPSEANISAFRLIDKNNKILGDVRFERTANGTQSSRLLVRSSASGSEVNGSIAVAINQNGLVFTEAPTPATGDNSTKIATTAFCANMATTTAPTTTSSASKTRPAWVVENYVNGTSWYRIWSDGWCEQGQCNHSAGGTGTVTVNLLKAYKDTNYTVTLSNGTTSSYASSIQTKTTTSFSGGYLDRRCDWYACGYIK